MSLPKKKKKEHRVRGDSRRTDPLLNGKYSVRGWQRKQKEQSEKWVEIRKTQCQRN